MFIEDVGKILATPAAGAQLIYHRSGEGDLLTAFVVFCLYWLSRLARARYKEKIIAADIQQ